MWRLLDIVDGFFGLQDAAPGTRSVLGNIDSGFASSEDPAFAFAVGFDCLRVLAAIRQAFFKPKPGHALIF